MRVLVASTGGAGHFGPLVPVVDAFVRRGDDVLLAVAPALAARARSTGLPYRLGTDPPAVELASLWERFESAPPREAAIIANREIFGRLHTAAMLPTMRDAVAEYRPKLVVREPCEYASAVAAEEADVPHVQVAISLAEVEASSLALASPVLTRYQHDLVQRLLTVPYLTRFPRSVDPSPFVATRRFREADELPADPLPDWWDGADTPLVYVTLGTVAGTLPATVAAYRAALDAVQDLPVRVLLTTGHGTDPARLGPIPANVHVEAWVPQRDILSSAAAVLCHGGSGTTFGALAAGVPLVIMPMFADQPSNARLVAAAGAGLVIQPHPSADPTVAAIGAEESLEARAAVERVLTDSSYRRGAARLAREMGALPSIDDLLTTVTSSILTP